MSQFPLFVGYTTLEQWRRVVDTIRPVFACLVTEPGREDKNAIRIDQMTILVAQNERGEPLVHYCRLPAGKLRFIGSMPFDHDHAARKEDAEQLWKLVETWLEEQGLTLRQGTIAMPTNARFMDGWADFLVFDDETQAYKRAEMAGDSPEPAIDSQEKPAV